MWLFYMPKSIREEEIDGLYFGHEKYNKKI
jgi:hypothetical protein